MDAPSQPGCAGGLAAQQRLLALYLSTAAIRRRAEAARETAMALTARASAAIGRADATPSTGPADGARVET